MREVNAHKGPPRCRPLRVAARETSINIVKQRPRRRNPPRGAVGGTYCTAFTRGPGSRCCVSDVTFVTSTVGLQVM